MTPDQLHALLLAGVLCVPMALLLWTRGATHAGSFEVPSGAALSPRVRLSATVVFVVSVAVVFMSLVLGVREQAGLGLPARHAAEYLLVAAAVALSAAPFYPLAGPLTYVVLSYLFPREHSVTILLMESGAVTAAAAFSIAGAVLSSWQRGRMPFRARNVLPWIVACFAASLAVSIVAAWFSHRPLGPDVVARTLRYAQAISLFLVVLSIRPGLRDVRLMAGLVGMTLIVRATLFTPGLLLEQNLAMLVVIAAPLVVMVAFGRPLSVVQLALAPIACGLVALVLVIQNRGAILGLAAAFVVLGATTRARWRWLAALCLAGLPAGFWALRSGLLDRFWHIYLEGQFVGSAGERLDIWRGGLAIIREHWIFGVGPGNFAVFRGKYAHNSILEILAEVGVAGMTLYVAMLLVACWELGRLAGHLEGDWRPRVRRGLMGVFAAHLVAGFFLSNANLVWSYMLLGLAASLTSLTEGPRDAV